MASAVSIKPVPEGFSAHTERNATILLPTQDKPFLNPIQEYNRDLSVAVIKHWGTIKEKALKSKWDTKQARRAKRNQGIDQKTEPNGEYERC
jgi:tRNA (guanine26-N2/guanine27-N2)-dimethyltransferase